MEQIHSVIKKLRDLKEKMTLHELSKALDVQQTTLWRWIKTGKMNPKMAEWLEHKIKKQKL